MKLTKLAGLSLAITMLSACGSGDIVINAQNNVDRSIGNNSGNVENVGGGTPTVNPCASYEAGGVLRQGSLSGVNCEYGVEFVDLTNPITTTETQVTFTNLDSDGVHVFNGSLVVGRNYDDDADMAAAGITEGGDGAVIRIEAGATLAFRSSDDYMVINRGSQIFAEGTSSNPITITSVSDAVDGTVGAEDVSQWGGLIVNGFGVTNKCAYTGNRGEAGFSTTNCHVAAEGKGGSGQTHYGGDNDADSSGVLEYFVVKHTGAQVAPGNELNGISFDAVGSGTTISNLQVYSTFDDGIEMFGGAVDIDNFVAVYVRDDSIDVDEGYIGSITNALVVQSQTQGNHCLESDGLGSYSSLGQTEIDAKVAAGLNSAAKITNLTCIVSPSAEADHDPGAGLRIREAHFAEIRNAIITTAYLADQVPSDDDGNYCVRIESAEGLQATQDGDLRIAGSVIACQDLTKGDALPNATTQADYLRQAANNNNVYQTAEAGEDPTTGNLVILDGFYSVPLASMVIGGNAATVMPVNSDYTVNTGQTYVGAVTRANDWTAGWTYGLHAGNRGQALWFE